MAGAVASRPRIPFRKAIRSIRAAGPNSRCEAMHARRASGIALKTVPSRADHLIGSGCEHLRQLAEKSTARG
jgi:hypothetical protein